VAAACGADAAPKGKANPCDVAGGAVGAKDNGFTGVEAVPNEKVDGCAAAVCVCGCMKLDMPIGVDGKAKDDDEGPVGVAANDAPNGVDAGWVANENCDVAGAGVDERPANMPGDACVFVAGNALEAAPKVNPEPVAAPEAKGDATAPPGVVPKDGNADG
jgi:hypothetical protein